MVGDLFMQVFQDGVVVTACDRTRRDPRLVDAVCDLKKLIRLTPAFVPNIGRCNGQLPTHFEGLAVCRAVSKGGIIQRFLMMGLPTVIVGCSTGSIPLFVVVQLQRSRIGNAAADREVCRSFGLVGDGVLIIRITGIELCVIELIGESGITRKFIGRFQNRTRAVAGNLEVTGHRVASRQCVLELKAVYGRIVGFDADSPCDLATFGVITAALAQLVVEMNLLFIFFVIGIDAVQ